MLYYVYCVYIFWLAFVICKYVNLYCTLPFASHICVDFYFYSFFFCTYLFVFVLFLCVFSILNLVLFFFVAYNRKTVYWDIKIFDEPKTKKKKKTNQPTNNNKIFSSIFRICVALIHNLRLVSLQVQYKLFGSYRKGNVLNTFNSCINDLA